MAPVFRWLTIASLVSASSAAGYTTGRPTKTSAVKTTTTTTTKSPACRYPKILQALKQNVDNGSDSFCQILLESVSYIGTLRQDPTYFFYATETDSRSTDVVYKYTATTIKATVTSTRYALQTRTAGNFTHPLASYVHQFPTAAVSEACSCLIGAGPTYLQYRPCEQATTTRRVSTTFTYTVGMPGTSTSTYIDTITQTKLKYTSAPFPTTCPDADGIDYVATDNTLWERGCKTYLGCYREIDTIKSTGLIACIESCVDYNREKGYKECQAVSFVPRTKDCLRVNEPCYFAHSDGGANVALLKFDTPPRPPGPDYCATVSGAAP